MFAQVVEIFSSIHVVGYIALALAVISFLTIPVNGWIRRKQEAKMKGSDENVPFIAKRENVDYPVIGYKTANIEGITLADDSSIADISFVGLVGIPYGVTGQTKASGKRKFNSYANIDNAVDHEQNWGSTLLEVVGYGEVEEHKLGYTAQKQRVLQVAFLECSFFYSDKIKCVNKPTYLGTVSDGDESYHPFCAGCVEKTNRSYSLDLFVNRSYDLTGGETIVVAAASTRKNVNIVPTILPKTEDKAEAQTDMPETETPKEVNNGDV